MYIQFFSSRTSRFLVLFLLFAGYGPAWPALATAEAASNTPMDEWPEWRGTVESMPAGGNSGSWTVGGRVFSADSGTQFEAGTRRFAEWCLCRSKVPDRGRWLSGREDW